MGDLIKLGDAVIRFGDSVGSFLLSEPFSFFSDILNSPAIKAFWENSPAAEHIARLAETSSYSIAFVLLGPAVTAVMLYKFIKWVIGIITGS